ncbi:MAG: glycerophosphodiester phosphodiesterase family protein [Myxococcota bacterium]
MSRTRLVLGGIAIGIVSFSSLVGALASGGLERLVWHDPRASLFVRDTVVAHRGFSHAAPENTLAAFRMARDLGVMIELDVTLAESGEVVCIHDDDLDRTTDGSGPVAHATHSEIRRLDAGSWFGEAFAGERVPTLDAVFAEIDARTVIDIELKTTDAKQALAGAVVDAIRRAGRVDSVFVSSFDPFLLEQVRLVEPSIRRAQLVDTFEGTDLAWYERVLLRNLAFNGQAQPDIVIGGDGFVTREWVERQKRRGYLVMVYTINEPRRMRELVDWGVDAIITDRPDVALTTLASRGSNHPG